MNLKYILKGFLFTSLIITFNACTDLEVEYQDSIASDSDGGFVAGDPGELLNALYTDLDALTDQANVYALSAHTSDEMIPPTRGTDWGDNGVWRVLHAHNWDGSNSSVVGAWNQLNERVFKATRILASSPDMQQTAETKFLRAFYMHQVLDLFGQVPFREVTEGVDVDPRVFTRSEALDFVITDLEEALPGLPVVAPTANNTQASKAAANALLARCYLNKAVWTAGNPEGPYTHDNADLDKVISYVDAVAADGYALDADYFNNFDPSGTNEIIMCTPTSGNPRNRIFMTLHYDQQPGGWNGFTTLAEFYDMFEDNDDRKGYQGVSDGSLYSGVGRGFLLGQQFDDNGGSIVNSRDPNGAPLEYTRDVPLAGASTEKGIRVMKYHPSNFEEVKYRILRFAESYLNKAEALMRKGNDADALAMVNQLRMMRGASALASLDEASMLAERGRELYWEGNRRQDQIRFGTFTDTWSEKSNTESFRVLFPIPSIALSSNPNLQQNTGY